MDLDSLLPIARASRYSNPIDSTALLPRSYGDFYSPAHIPADHADGGFLPAVSVNQLEWVYLLNDGPLPAGPPPWIYAADTVQPNGAGLYTWYPAIDYQNTGHVVSIVQFHVNPGTRPISWRGYGTANPSSGVIITNPIDALADAFGYLGGWSVNDIDPVSVAQTRADMMTLGDTVHWCFQQDLSYREWLRAILQHYHCDFWEQVDGKLRVTLDRSLTTLQPAVLHILNAETDLIGSSVQPVRYGGDASNLVNTIRISRRRKWTNGAYTEQVTVANQASVNVYGTRYMPAAELPACYSDAEGLRWFNGMIMRYAFKPYTLTFTVRGLGLSSALPGTFLGLIWPKQGWTTPRLIKVFNMTDDHQQIAFVCWDCGRTVDEELILPDITTETARSPGAEASLAVDVTPPGPASQLSYDGSYRRIVLRWMTPGDLDYDHTEIWASFNANNRANASFIRNGGYRKRSTIVEETFEVGDDQTYYVWFMTVDADGNGKDGGSGPTGGNWSPASPTGGFQVSSITVPTEGIATGAVSDRSTGITLIGQDYHSGEFAVSVASLGGFFPTGDVRILGRIGVGGIGSIHTVIIKIYRGFVGGPLVGVDYLTNPLTVPAPVEKFCPGDDADPAWNGQYFMTVQSIAQDGSQQGWIFSYARLDLFHTKR